MLAGTVAAGLLEESVAVTPADPAGDVSVTVPVEELPPVTVEGLIVTLAMVPWVEGGDRARLPVTVFADVAEIVTGVELATADVGTVKVAVV